MSKNQGIFSSGSNDRGHSSNYSRLLPPNEFPIAHQGSRSIFPISARTSELGNNVTAQPYNDEEELVILDDQGVNRLFPNEPEISKEFKEYLQSIQDQDPEKIFSLPRRPPLTLQSKRPNGSYCFTTLEDLEQVRMEIGRTCSNWSVSRQAYLKENRESTIELLNLHEYLISHVLRAKELCIRDFRRRHKKGEWTGPTSFIYGESEKEIATVASSLYWQTGIYNNLYSQSLMMPFMVQKRNGEVLGNP